MRYKLARHVKALQNGLVSLEAYYTQLKAAGSSTGQPLRNPTLPYPCSFSSNPIRNFTYDERGEGHNLVFFGKFQDGDCEAICIKFTRYYCQQAHEFCASKGRAPKLYTVESYPGGWYMVVMDDIRKDYVSLFDFIDVQSESQDYADVRNSLSEEISAFLSDLHQQGLVHGDIRNTNIMVRRSGSDVAGAFQLLDFDWSGRIDEARYPLDINTTTVKRPDGVAGNNLIEAAHDIQMLEYIWNVDYLGLV